MKNDKSSLIVGGGPLAERLTADLPAITKLVLAEVTKRIPAYRVLPAEELSGDITTVIEQTLRSFITVLRTRTLPTKEELDFLRESAARRAEEGIPIDVVLTAYHIGIQVVWNSLTPHVRPEEVDGVMAVNALVLRYLELVTPAVCAGYLDERQTMFDDEHSARHTLLAALLDGGTAVEAAATRTGLRLPPYYVVLALSVGVHPDETSPGTDPVIAGRRKLRRLRAELERHVRGPVLSSLTPDGGLALLPHSGEPNDHDWARLNRIVADVARAAGTTITAAAEVAVPAGVAAAATSAQEVLEVALRFGKPPKLYVLRDLLLEYQLSRPSNALGHLATLLDPLAGNEELLETLRVFLRHSGRRPTAGSLHVHPNTVDYRLRRITDLTGLDPTRVGDAALLGAALAAHTASAVNRR
ncbi:transcriptional regulator [Lentzea sp. NBRC 105346]|uniref:PucR family transcriptional regulator n=1 Tax=Lentzea sp. NBRC 105346 TaxID=3032205 RepID=UPI0024A5F87D|nr:helix-turn-helix domain-containing protein [Lentzea sp. NBRC 105346]GLZ32008.1 transcriptional regulator [Lentzea sp. NBRC 105346]